MTRVVEMRRSVSDREFLTAVGLALLAGHNLAQFEAEILAPPELDEESNATVCLDACSDRDRERAVQKHSITP